MGIFLLNISIAIVLVIAALQAAIFDAPFKTIQTTSLYSLLPYPWQNHSHLIHSSDTKLVVTDDSGIQIQLSTPAQRIITLTPHAAELVYAAEAGAYLVGVVSFSDYPISALNLPRVGDAARINKESILALHPDLIIAWPSGNRPQDLTWLEQHHFIVYRSEPATLEAIADNLLDLGTLTATTAAKRAARDFSSRLAQLRQRYSGVNSHCIFYQVWATPLITLGSEHLINQVFKICGAQNLFPHLTNTAAIVSKEAVLLANPYAIIADTSVAGVDAFLWWQRWTFLDAVRWQRFIDIPSELLQRPTPRILDGMERLCLALQRFRVLSN